jgi:hypothetical protein
MVMMGALFIMEVQCNDLVEKSEDYHIHSEVCLRTAFQNHEIDRLVLLSLPRLKFLVSFSHTNGANRVVS